MAHDQHVVIISRDGAHGAQAVSDIQQAGSGRIELLVGDLSSVESTRSVAQSLLDCCQSVAVLIHNAGLWPTRLSLNQDGLERSFAVNHIAPFLLNHLLKERLVEGRARVVQVSAGIYPLGKVDLKKTPTGQDFSRLKTYATTKLCNLVTTRQFAKRWANTGVTFNAVHPGVIRTDLGAMAGPLGWLMKLVKRTWRPPAEGAPGPVHLALAEELSGQTGLYFNELQRAELQDKATDEPLAEKLWQQALELTGLSTEAELR